MPTEAIASSLSAEVTDRLLDSADLQRIVEHVAASPEVQVAMTRQTASLADDLVGGLRRRTEHVGDLEAQGRARSWFGRGPRRFREGPYAGIAARTVAFALDIMLALAIFLTGAALAGARRVVGGRPPAAVVRRHPHRHLVDARRGWVLRALLDRGRTDAGDAGGALRMRVTNHDEQPPGTGRAILRFVRLLLAIVPLFAGFIPMLLDRRRHGLQDYLLGATVVLYTDRRTPLEAGTASPVPHDAAKPDMAG